MAKKSETTEKRPDEQSDHKAKKRANSSPGHVAVKILTAEKLRVLKI